MKDLIERLERLDGPCRECDCLIALEAGWDVQNMSLPLSDLVKRFGVEWLYEAATEYNSVYKALPAYTGSIDAAMSLVPDGWQRFDVDATAPELGVDWVLHGPNKAMAKGTAATPAIALCIASLRLMGDGK